MNDQEQKGAASGATEVAPPEVEVAGLSEPHEGEFTDAELSGPEPAESTLHLFQRLRGPADLLRGNDRIALRDHLVLVHAPLVEHCARGFAATGEPVEDLVQEGYVGLIKAVDRFDPDKGVRFSTYACHLINGEIRHYLRDLGKLIHEPGWHFELRQRITRVADQLTNQFDRAPQPEEIAAALNIAVDTVRDVLKNQSTLNVDSLDRESDNEDEGGESRTTEIPASGMPLESGVDNRLMLGVALPQLRDLEKRVVTLFFFQEKSKTEIARELGISINYAAYLIKRGIESLRDIIETSEVVPSEVLTSAAWPQNRARAAYLLALAKSAGASSIGPSPMMQPENIAATVMASGAFDPTGKRDKRRVAAIPVVPPPVRSNLLAFAQWVGELDDEVQRAARYAQEFGLLWLRSPNWPAVMADLDSSQATRAQNSVQTLARRCVRNVDKISLLPPGAMTGLNFLVLMPHTTKGGDRAGERWVKSCRPETLLAQNPAALNELEFQFAFAVFPRDGQSADALFGELGNRLRQDR